MHPLNETLLEMCLKQHIALEHSEAVTEITKAHRLHGAASEWLRAGGRHRHQSMRPIYDAFIGH